MKLNNIMKTLAVLVAGALMMGCQQERSEEAKAVATSETYVTFHATGAADQVIKVYADGLWNVDVDSPWISVSPMKGDGHGTITISVTDNATGSTIDRPRDGTIVIQGKYVSRQTSVTVHQDGDTYYGVDTYTLAQIRSLENGDVAKVAQAQVVALSTKGFIASDESGCLYVQGEGLSLGDKVSFNGTKTTVNNAPAFVLDEFDVVESGKVVYPEAKDITATLADYDATVAEYVSLSASLIGTDIYVNDKISIPILDPVEELKLGALDLHKVVFKGYAVGQSMLVTSVEDGGMDESLIPYPLKFRVRVDNINYTTESFSESSQIKPVQGLGYIEYVPVDLATTDDNKKYKLDVSDKSPRVTGPWPGDYWLFYGNGAIKAGSEVHIAFEARTSATGHKFWMLEFLDGDQWRPACETLTSNEPGEDVVYTHAMNADGATNVQANYVVKYRKNSEHAQFRFRCVANWQASGAGKLSARNGGSARLTVTNKDDETFQPIIEIVKEGNGIEKDPVYANIELSANLLTFNGTPAAPKEVTITSDYDFTVSTSADWLSLDQTEGLAGEPLTVKVTCAESQLSELREATIKVVSEDSEAVINVVQSAAGQLLDPFVSISGGNKAEVNELEGSIVLKIQSNVEVSAETADPWLKVEMVPETKALVEWTEYTVSYEANESAEPRTGTIRFFNEKEKVESILTLVQSGKEPEPIYPEGVYFQDDFEWLSEWSAYTVDDVANKSVASSSPNIFTKAEVSGALAEFQKRGYGYIWGWKGQDWSDGTPDNSNKQTLYLMKNYLKFGKTSYNSGIILPALTTIPGIADVELSFDWAWCMTKASKPDIMTLTVTVSGGGTIAATGTTVSGNIESAQPTEGDLTKLEWQHAKVKILGATPETRITIRPTNTDPSISSSRDQNRWYLDNIKVAEPEASVEVGTALWTEWWQGASDKQTPSAYSASETRTTKTFGNASVTYTEGGSSTALKADGLVYYNSKDNIANEDYRYNLLVANSGGYLDASGIPCKGVKTAKLTYRSNTKLDSHQVTSSTTGVTVGTLSATSVPKIDLATKNTYTVTCTISIAEGVETLDLRITDIGSANIRVDGIELVVTEL